MHSDADVDDSAVAEHNRLHHNDIAQFSGGSFRIKKSPEVTVAADPSTALLQVAVTRLTDVTHSAPVKNV